MKELKNKHTFPTDKYNVIIEHKEPFSKFTALKQLKKNNILLRNPI